MDDLRARFTSQQVVVAVQALRRQRPMGHGQQAAGPEASPPAAGLRQPGTWFQGDPRRVEAVAALRDKAGGIEDISLLRCLDIIVWMQATGRSTQPPTTNGTPT